MKLHPIDQYGFWTQWENQYVGDIREGQMFPQRRDDMWRSLNFVGQAIRMERHV